MAQVNKRYESDSDLKWYQRVLLEVIWVCALSLGYSPRWYRFGVVQPLFCVLLRLVRYRRKVIVGNLQHSFPEKSSKEINKIVRGYYTTLAEIIVDIISLAGTSPKRDPDLVTWVGRDEHEELNRGRDWIAMASHYGCWEYLPLWVWRDSITHFVTVYHPMRSPLFERFFARLRNFAPNMHQVPMSDAIRHYIRMRNEGRNVVLGLVSDQSPNMRPDTVWFDFLNQKTAFVDGAEKLAMKFGMPVYFVHTERIAPGRYAVRLDEIYDGVEAVEPHEITRRYAVALEAMIRKTPELWMWSHRRWRHSPESQARKFGKSTLEA